MARNTTFNRTSMELKPVTTMKEIMGIGMLLIEPVWN